ncbi:hypothetical protein [Halobellus limi]|uniref:Uncharacterized protein n=1 Tax=Halobellus limi TaxID=699433 RepID=A0A1H5YUX7_9EURY|nr:hypothetical protein [Halobellus limi]QCC48327.1 hypothetical protein DV707_12015 [Halobellus limi]SEG27818.1 hypothetical protein SAMN04488133_1731 [Halobellus limi]
MTTAPFEQIAAATEGDEVRVTLAADSATVGGVELDSPIVTRVAAISEETVDARQKDVDIDGIVDRRILRLAPVSGDDRHEAYVLETRSPVVGEETVCPLRARPRSGCGPADDVGTLPDVGEVETVEVRS